MASHMFNRSNSSPKQASCDSLINVTYVMIIVFAKDITLYFYIYAKLMIQLYTLFYTIYALYNDGVS